MRNKEHINVVWLKRDLRLQDNEAIANALKTGKRTILLYVFEHILLNDSHYSERHFNFIKESIKDLNTQLEPYNTKVLSVTSDITSALNQLQSFYKIDTVFSHIETGLLVTYNRDKEFIRYCRNNLISWTESKNNGVERGLVNRANWFDNWESYMYRDLETFQPSENQLLGLPEIKTLENIFTITNLETPKKTSFQKGGSEIGWKYANSFFESRHQNYMFNISNLKPQEAVAVEFRLISLGEIYL